MEWIEIKCKTAHVWRFPKKVCIVLDVVHQIGRNIQHQIMTHNDNVNKHFAIWEKCYYFHRGVVNDSSKGLYRV